MVRSFRLMLQVAVLAVVLGPLSGCIAVDTQETYVDIASFERARATSILVHALGARDGSCLSLVRKDVHEGKGVAPFPIPPGKSPPFDLDLYCLNYSFDAKKFALEGVCVHGAGADFTRFVFMRARSIAVWMPSLTSKNVDFPEKKLFTDLLTAQGVGFRTTNEAIGDPLCGSY